MGVTRTGSQGEEAKEAERPSEPDVQEHPANALTATEQPTTQVDPPTSQLLAGSMGDTCANCGAPMAGDQRYCVHCGERRGGSRFFTSTTPAATVTKTVGPPPERSRSWPAAATVIAGIATLLLAMGVGVLIGKAGNSGSSKAPAAEVITVNGGGSTAAGTSSGSTGSSLGATQNGATTHHTSRTAAHTSKSQTTKAKTAVKAAKPTTGAVKKASQAASGVTGGSAGQSNNTVTTGSSCKAGSAGCTNGHFSGNFFGQ